MDRNFKFDDQTGEIDCFIGPPFCLPYSEQFFFHEKQQQKKTHKTSNVLPLRLPMFSATKAELRNHLY